RRCKTGGSLDLAVWDRHSCLCILASVLLDKVRAALVGLLFLCWREPTKSLAFGRPLYAHAKLGLPFGARLPQDGYSIQRFGIEAGYQVNVAAGILLPELAHLNFRHAHSPGMASLTLEGDQKGVNCYAVRGSQSALLPQVAQSHPGGKIPSGNLHPQYDILLRGDLRIDPLPQ